MLNVRDGELRCGSRLLMHHLTFDVKSGELCVLMGPSGLGKTTLLRAIVDLHDPSKVLLTGLDRENVSGVELQKGYIAQGEKLVPWLTVEKNIMLPFLLCPSIRPVVNGGDKEDLLRLLEIQHLLERAASTVSGGEAQRILLARTILSSDKVLILDEPWSHLDAPLRRRMLEALKVWLRRNSFTALVVAHEPEDAVRFCTKALVVNSGGALVREISEVRERAAFRARLIDALCHGFDEEVSDAA
jgi:ABC-type nitrate/sulfonate/bicarbonate transport system ATPase subunit